MALPLLAAAVPAIGSVLGSAFNANQQKKANKRSENFSREMYGKQRADALSDWNMQNAYNDPAAQMQRLKDANLNPNLVYGNGADAGAPAPMRASQSSQPTFKAPSVDAGGIVQNAMMMKQIQSNIAKTDAETERINADTLSLKYQNQFLTPEMFANEYEHRSSKAQYGASNEETNAHIRRLEAETQNLLSGYSREHNSFKTPDLQSPTKHLKIQEIESRIKQIVESTKGIETSTALKNYEKEIIDSFGISASHAGTAFSNILKLILLKR